MGYIGNTPSRIQAAFQGVESKSFDGDGANRDFTLDRAVANTYDIEVVVNNVQQSPYDGSYSVSGTTLSFSEAPSTGTNNVYVTYRDTPQPSIVPQDGTVTTAKISDGAVTAAKLAAGAAVPDQTGHAGQFLTTDGTTADWATVDALPDQTGNSGYYLTTDGTTASWSTVPNEITKAPTDPTITTNGSFGDIYLNTTSGEMYACIDATSNANVWKNIGEGSGSIVPDYTIEYVIQAGGGGGGYRHGGGGGAGGYRTSHASDTSGANSSTETPFTATPGVHVYTIVVGGGGNGGSGEGSNGTNGDNSSIAVSGGSTITSSGGGFGRSSGTSSTGNGGCGGGGRASLGTGGSGTTGQGEGGGGGGTNSGGGGGGTNESGANGDNSPVVYGYGGDGTVSTILTTANATSNSVGEVDSSQLYFGGGGGAGWNTGGDVAGGLGGGGNGRDNNQTGTNGTAYTGGGGGGGGGDNGASGGNGGSGVVILRMPTYAYSGTYTGDNVTAVTEGSDTILIFKSSGTYTA